MVLLVTTDFSPNSKTAIRFAIQMAKQVPSKIVLYHALDLLIPTGWNRIQTEPYTQTSLEYCTNNLKKMAKKLFKDPENAAISYECVVDLNNDFNNAVIAYAQKIKADFICMGTHGAGTLKKAIGTNASVLINTSPIPVIAVPHNYRTKPITKVGYASDFENFEGELNKVKQLAEWFKLPVEVYHFNYLIHDTNVQKAIERIISKYQSDSVHIISSKIAIDYNLVENIQRRIKEEKTSLLVMFSRGKNNWFERFFLESRTAEMTFGMKIPLIAFRK